MAGPPWPVPDLSDNPGELAEGMGPMKPEQKSRYFAKWWPQASPETDFLMDLDVKRTKNATGIPSVRLQDSAVLWSMGPIMDRTLEHLCTTDSGGCTSPYFDPTNTVTAPSLLAKTSA